MARTLLAVYALAAVAAAFLALATSGIRDSTGPHDWLFGALAVLASAAAVASVVAARSWVTAVVPLYLLQLVCAVAAVATSHWSSGIRVAPPVIAAGAVVE